MHNLPQDLGEFSDQLIFSPPVPEQTIHRSRRTYHRLKLTGCRKLQQSAVQVLSRRGGRVAECTGLENQRTFTRTGGSNPPLSAFNPDRLASP